MFSTGSARRLRLTSWKSPSRWRRGRSSPDEAALRSVPATVRKSLGQPLRQQRGRGERLSEPGERAGREHPVHGSVEIPQEVAKHEYRQERAFVASTQELQRLGAAHAGQLPVEDQDVRNLRVERPAKGGCIAKHDDSEACVLEPQSVHLGDRGVVVDEDGEWRPSLLPRLRHSCRTRAPRHTEKSTTYA